MRRITFEATSELAWKSGIKPESSKRFIPEWFKKLTSKIPNSQNRVLQDNGDRYLSAKACAPLLDAFTSGYMLRLEVDLEVTQKDGFPFFTWGFGPSDTISTHSSDQLGDFKFPEWAAPQTYKFITQQLIKPPKGYSILVTHPLNRMELPFLTFSAVVDADRYNRAVNLPFVFSKTFQGIIPAGTPIAQIIPIKREHWSSAYKEFDAMKELKRHATFRAKIYGAYKQQSWVKKTYQDELTAQPGHRK